MSFTVFGEGRFNVRKFGPRHWPRRSAFHPFLPLWIGAEWVWLRDRISPRANGSVDLRGGLDAAV